MTPSLQRVSNLLRFISSMPVAVFLLGLVAIASMIGTILVQNQPDDFYIANLGPTWFRLLDALDLFNMYGSWWFISIMVLLALSVGTALLRHGPRFWYLSRPMEAMRPWPNGQDGGFSLNTPLAGSPDKVEAILRRLGFNEFRRGEEQGAALLLARKGRRSRLGFFLVHGSVVAICLGALITSQLGFRGSMNIAQGEAEQIIYVDEGKQTRRLLLPFEVRNDEFNITFYKSGMPSEYSSHLTLLKEGKALLSKRITVNDPLRYQGVTFYQSSFGDAGSKVEFIIHDLTMAGFPEQKVKTEVYRELQDSSGMKITVENLRQHNVMNMAQEEGMTELKDVGPALDIHLSSPVSGNITYRSYLAYPHLLAFARMGEDQMTIEDLGFSPTDSLKMSLLSAYLIELKKIGGERDADKNRAAFAAAMNSLGLPLTHAAELGPAIATAEKVLRQHKIPLLFSFTAFTPKMYTGLQVARDPGAPLVWLACAVLVIGLYMMIYLRERRIWVRFDEAQQQLEVCALISGKDKHPVHATLARLQRALQARENEVR